MSTQKFTQDQIDEMRENYTLPEGFVEADMLAPSVDPDIVEAAQLADQIAPTGFQWDERAGGNLLSDLKRNFTPDQWKEFALIEHTWDEEGSYGGSGEPVVIDGLLTKASAVLPPLPNMDSDEEEDVDMPEGPVAPVVTTPNPPKNRTEELWNQDEIDHARKLAPSFEMNYGRFDPFSKDILSALLNTRSFSVLIQRPVHHLDDAIAHATTLCNYWSKEDIQAAKDEAADPAPTVSKKEERVEAARIAWKTAVTARKEAIAQWDAYVGHLRRRFQRTRDRR